MRLVGSKRFGNWRFAQLSILLMVFLIISPFISNSWFFQLMIQLFMLNSLVVVLSASTHRRPLGRLLWSLWGVTAAAMMLRLFSSDNALRNFSEKFELVCLVLLLFICVVCILYYLFRHLRADFDGIFASLSAYLLLALGFGMLFALLFSANPHSFRFPESMASTEPNRIDLIYFSFVTIATLGYGDIVPVTAFARMLAVMEAVAGQFYVAVIVSMLVGSIISRSRQISTDQD